MSPPDFFTTAFRALTDNSPFPWQRTLYLRFVSDQHDNIPPSCNLPTGLGKTSVLVVWLLALATPPHKLPRRLLYIVNRRTVVDQATSIVQRIRDRLRNPDHADRREHADTLRPVVESLQRLAASENEPLAVSTLRGELADNEEWKTDPARPAIIVGTIDMVGSKLLFSGYGDGAYHRTHHAGLIGQDALVIHDEAHLTPAFSDLLRAVEIEQRRAHEQYPDSEPKRIRVMELSATTRGGNSEVLELGPEDEQDARVQQRLDATKIVRLHEVSDPGTGADGKKPKAKRTDLTLKIAQLARQHEAAPAKVLIYIRSPEDAQKLADQLKDALGNGADERVAVLTGTIRGHERDETVGTNPVYRALLNHDLKVNEAMYLVSTSAGEVGIDLDADHMVCDLTTMDSLIQRLGRTNRRGGPGRTARIDLVMPMTKANSPEGTSGVERAMHATQALLKKWADNSGGEFNAGPRALRALMAKLTDEEKTEAFSPKPAVAPFTDVLFDAWSLTSVTESMPGRPEVAPYLHGLTNDPPETFVVWRKEVELLARAEPPLDPSTLRDWFRACRIEARERLHDRTDRVRGALDALLKAHRKKDKDRDFFVVVLDECGEVVLDERQQGEWLRLSRIVADDFKLEYRTVVLPPEAGGLSAYGMLDSNAIEGARDVAEESQEGRRERWLSAKDQGDEPPKRYERLLTGEVADVPPPGLRKSEWITLKEPEEGAENDGESKNLVLFTRKQLALENPETAKCEQSLVSHTKEIVAHVSRMTEALRLEQPIREALALAARWHDRGKARRVWQYYACNRDLDRPLAKSKVYRHWSALGGYRHEFGSLLDASDDPQIAVHPERDLILHLIAAHHGWARPHFRPRAHDVEKFTTARNEDQIYETMQRFGRLQQRFGRWGLAWLESLLRCADIAASRPVAESPPASRPQEALA